MSESARSRRMAAKCGIEITGYVDLDRQDRHAGGTSDAVNDQLLSSRGDWRSEDATDQAEELPPPHCDLAYSVVDVGQDIMSRTRRWAIAASQRVWAAEGWSGSSSPACQ